MRTHLRLLSAGKEVSLETDLLVDGDELMTPAQEMAGALGATTVWRPESRQLTVLKGNVSVDFVADRDKLWYRDEHLTMPAAPRMVGTALYVPVGFLAKLLGAHVVAPAVAAEAAEAEDAAIKGGAPPAGAGMAEETAPPAEAAPVPTEGPPERSGSSEPTPPPEPPDPQEQLAPVAGWAADAQLDVLLDPEHGGTSKETVGPGGVRQADVTLDIARRTMLALAGRRVNVSLMRQGDIMLSADHRRGLRARQLPAIYVNVRTSYYPTGTVSGFEVNHPSGQAESARLAQLIHRELAVAAGRPGRGTRPAQLAVFEGFDGVTVCVRVGFLSSEDETALLGTEEYRDKLAAALAQGLLLHLRR